MPTKKSAYKALRQSKKRALRNKKIKDNIKALIKKCRKTIEAKDKEKAKEIALNCQKALDKAAQKGILKKNTVARKKSRLMSKIKEL